MQGECHHPQMGAPLRMAKVGGLTEPTDQNQQAQVQENGSRKAEAETACLCPRRVVHHKIRTLGRAAEFPHPYRYVKRDIA